MKLKTEIIAFSKFEGGEKERFTHFFFCNAEKSLINFPVKDKNMKITIPLKLSPGKEKSGLKQKNPIN